MPICQVAIFCMCGWMQWYMDICQVAICPVALGNIQYLLSHALWNPEALTHCALMKLSLAHLTMYVPMFSSLKRTHEVVTLLT